MNILHNIPQATGRCLFCDGPVGVGKKFCPARCYHLWAKREGGKQENNVNADLFWSYVDRRGIDDCWNWKKGVTPNGYGSFTCKMSGHKRTYTSNRVAFFLHFGVIIDGIYALHQCNNKRCCNPSHLYPGTHTQNMQDMIAAGVRIGEQTWNHKLYKDDIIKIREMYARGGYTHRRLAGLFGVSSPTITMIINRKVWRHI